MVKRYHVYLQMTYRYEVDHWCVWYMKYVLALIAFVLSIFHDNSCYAELKAETDFIIGAQTHFAQLKGNAELNLPLIKKAGIVSIRDEIYWDFVENKKGELIIPGNVEKAVNIALKNGLQPLIILDYGNNYYDGGGMPVSDKAQAAFVRYALFVAKHFKGKVRYFEIWNEWNGGMGYRLHQSPPPNFKADPKAYINLLAKSYTALKHIDSNIIVVGGGVAGCDGPWIRALLDKGALNYLDMLSIHPYNYNGEINGTPENLMEWLIDIEVMLKSYSKGKEVPIFLTEIGWPNHIGNLGVTPETTASFLCRLFLLAKATSFVKGIWWYDFQNDGLDQNNAEHNFGLVKHDLSPKPGYFAVRDIAKYIGSAKYIDRINTHDPAQYLIKYNNNGQGILAAWTSRKGGYMRLTLHKNIPDNVRITFLHTGKELPVKYKLLTKKYPEIIIPVDGNPLLIMSDLSLLDITTSWQRTSVVDSISWFLANYWYKFKTRLKANLASYINFQTLAYL